jgi:hypothetical protein
MKKTIKILAEKMDKLQELNEGTLQGGFTSIKGGFAAFELSTNDNWGCTNAKNCVGSTNTGQGCTNDGVCFN